MTPEEFRRMQKNIPGSGIYEIIVEKAFNSKMMEIFQRSDVEEILGQMFARTSKTQTENPCFAEAWPYVRQHNAPRHLTSISYS